MRLVFSLLVLLAPLVAAGPRTFENTAVVRTIELGGSLVHVTTTYAIRALGEGNGDKSDNIYTFALTETDEKWTTWVEARIKGQSDALKVNKYGFSVKDHAFLYTVTLPKLGVNGTTTLVVDTVQSHAAIPWPAAAKQADPQSLKYETELFVLSAYPTVVQRIKLRSPAPKISSYTLPEKLEGLDQYLSGSAGSKSGATITYGPFHNVPPTSNYKFQREDQRTVDVQYDYDDPVLTVVNLKRSAEVSHWGANLNIQDEITLRNDGPVLKGQFSRLEHQQQQYFGRQAAQSIREIALQLPAGIHSPYFYDQIGNVSTSHFRPTPSIRRGASEKWSILEFKPRYPLLGGWNYTFTLGWDAPLADWASYEGAKDRYVLAVPFLEPIPGAAVDHAEMKIVLPEGATDVTVHPPFEVDSLTRQTHVTYLDTTGRPAIVFNKAGLTSKHIGAIYITYKLPLSAHFKKPIAVAVASLSLFALALVARRVDPRIQNVTPAKKAQ